MGDHKVSGLDRRISLWESVSGGCDLGSGYESISGGCELIAMVVDLGEI